LLGDLDYDSAPAEALPHYQASRKLREQLLHAEPGSAAATRSLVVALERIGDMQMKLEDPSAAAEAFREAVELLDGLLLIDPRNRDILRSAWIEKRNLGDALAAARDPKAAAESYERALERAGAYESGGNPSIEERTDIADLGRRAALALRELARLARAEGDGDAAKAHLTLALEHLEQSVRRYDALTNDSLLEIPAQRNAGEARRLLDEMRATLSAR
jgi:tetratricopeptide (TPR) repeat protein